MTTDNNSELMGLDMKVNMKRLNLAKTSLAIAISCALSTVSYQTVAAADENKKMNVVGTGIERISVTAEKRVKTLQETPIAITAFDSESLENLGIYNITDVSSLAPNVTINPTLGSSFNVSMNIRGLSTAEPSLAVDPKVGVYLDGVYLARNSGAIFDIVDLERMEILRGPQGTLWGKNTTGGAINMVTTKPSDTFAVKTKATMGNYGLWRSTTSVDTGEFNNFSAKLSYMKDNKDGWVDNTYAAATEKKLGAQETDAFRIVLKYEADSFTVDYSYDNTAGESVPTPLQIANVGEYFINPTTPTMNLGNGGFYGGNVFAMMAANLHDSSRQDKFSLDGQGREHVDISGHNLTFSWDADENTQVKSISSYRKYDSSFLGGGADLDGGSYFGAELGQNFQPTGNFAPIPAFHTQNIKKQDQWSQEFQLIGSLLDNKLDYVVGLYHFEEEGSEDNPWDITIFTGQGANLLFSGAKSWGVYYNIKSSTNAVFSQFTYHVTDKLGVTAGVRYTEDEKELTNLAENDGMLDEDLHGKTNWDKTTTSFVVDYQVNNDLSLYAKFGEGYAAGTYNPGSIFRFGALTPAGADYSKTLIPADPEETTAYEAGVKAMLLDDRLMINSAIFFNDNKNLQTTDFVDSTRVTINSGASETIGIEFDIMAMPTDNITLSATYGYRKTDVNEESVVTDSETNSASLALNWDIAELDIGTLAIHGSYVFTDEREFSSSNPDLKADSHTLLNARLTLSNIEVGNGSLNVSAWGRNITDEEYIVHGASFSFYDGYTYGDPATYGIDVTYEF